MKNNQNIKKLHNPYYMLASKMQLIILQYVITSRKFANILYKNNSNIIIVLKSL